MSREVCGVCWTPYDDNYKCACPTPALDEVPYAWMAVGGSIWRNKGSEDDVPLYTRPQPRREWRGLTDEEIEDCWDGYLSDYQLQMIRTIEDKLKEKNA